MADLDDLTYALLLLPSANRVYADAAVELTMAELEVFNERCWARRLAGSRRPPSPASPT